MFFDSCILVAARFMNHSDNATIRCLDCIGNSEETLHISRQIIREYLAVVTRHQTWAKPIPIADALEDVTKLISSFIFLEDGPEVIERLILLCREFHVGGKAGS